MNVSLRLNTNVLLYLNYVRMLITPNLSFESESYEPHVIVRAETRLLKVAHWGLVAEAARIFRPEVLSDDDVKSCRNNVGKYVTLHSEIIWSVRKAAWECITLDRRDSFIFTVLESKDVSWIQLFIVSVSVT